MKKNQPYDLEERLLEYSVRIIKLTEQMSTSKAGSHVAGQLLRSGTSPYPNHGEAQAVESPKDFVHKLRMVRQQGYLKGGLRRRCVESLFIPPQAKTGVLLCKTVFS